MKNIDNYIALLECAVLSLLAERKDVLQDIIIPSAVSDHPSFKEGGTFSPYNLWEKITEMRTSRS